MLSVLIALGPFLHAHYGVSKVTGLHVAGVSAVATKSEPELTTISFTQDDEQESAAVGVETSYARQVGLDVQDPSESVLIFTLFAMVAVIQRLVVCLLKLDTQRAGRPSFLAGFPPLPHAPPSLAY